MRPRVFVRTEFEGVQLELDGVKELYVGVCREKDQLDALVVSSQLLYCSQHRSTTKQSLMM